jgi:hypothetical protein
MAFFGSAVSCQRQAFRDGAEADAFLNTRIVQTLQSDTPMVTVPLLQYWKLVQEGDVVYWKCPESRLLILTQIFPSLCYENSTHPPSLLVFSKPYLSSCLYKNTLAFCPPYQLGAHQLKA